MIKKFTLALDGDLRAKVKATAALNGYENMNAFIVEAIEEKIKRIELENTELKKVESVAETQPAL